MRRLAALVALLLLPATLEGAEVSGTVRNGTTGLPAAGLKVTLLALRGGMVPVRETTTDAGGRFQLVTEAAPGENFLVRVIFVGVTYNQPAVFSSGERITADLEVYEATAPSSALTVESNILVFEPHRDHVRITEAYEVHNHSRPPQTYAPRSGSFAFALPAGARQLEVSTAGPSGMPVRQAVREDEEAGLYSIDSPLKPKQTEVRVTYSLPLKSNTLSYARPLAPPVKSLRFAVPAAGVEVEGRGLKEIPQSEFPGARIYALDNPGPEVKMTLRFDPEALVSAAPTAAAPAPAASAESAVSIIAHPVAEAKWTVLGLTLFVLALGLYHLYSLPVPRPDDDTARHSQPRA